MSVGQLHPQIWCIAEVTFLESVGTDSAAVNVVELYCFKNLQENAMRIYKDNVLTHN